VSSEQPHEGTGGESPDQSDTERHQPPEPPVSPEQPAESEQPAAPEHGEATPYVGYGSPGVHPIPSQPQSPQVPSSPADPGARPAEVTGPTTSPTYHGPPYPGETYPVYPPGHPIYPGQPPYPPGQPRYQPGFPGQPAYPGYPGAVETAVRPGQVTAGVVMSWVGGGVFALFGLLLFALAANKDLLDGVEQQLDQQINRDQATTLFRTLGVGLGIWGIAVIVFAVLAWNGKNWARIALTIMGGCYCASQLFGIVSGAVAGLPFLAYVVIAVGLLWTRPAGAWFADSSYGPGSGGKPPPIVW
jgi:hypothetical protein